MTDRTVQTKFTAVGGGEIQLGITGETIQLEMDAAVTELETEMRVGPFLK